MHIKPADSDIESLIMRHWIVNNKQLFATFKYLSDWYEAISMNEIKRKKMPRRMQNNE